MMKPPTVFLGEMTNPEVEAFVKTNRMVIVPTGAVEQHGPHGPLLTDVLIPTEVARRAAPALGAAVAPPINYALSYPHKGFTGVVYLRMETFRALVSEMGGEVFSAMPPKERGYGIATGGSIIHELGTVRMGSDPKTSVLNEWCQAWDCKNLFVADGGPFVSQADKNPTWTIMAMAMRTSDRILELRKAGTI